MFVGSHFEKNYAQEYLISPLDKKLICKISFLSKCRSLRIS